MKEPESKVLARAGHGQCVALWRGLVFDSLLISIGFALFFGTLFTSDIFFEMPMPWAVVFYLSTFAAGFVAYFFLGIRTIMTMTWHSVPRIMLGLGRGRPPFWFSIKKAKHLARSLKKGDGTAFFEHLHDLDDSPFAAYARPSLDHDRIPQVTADVKRWRTRTYVWFGIGGGFIGGIMAGMASWLQTPWPMLGVALLLGPAAAATQVAWLRPWVEAYRGLVESDPAG